MEKERHSKKTKKKTSERSHHDEDEDKRDTHSNGHKRVVSTRTMARKECLDDSDSDIEVLIQETVPSRRQRVPRVHNVQAEEERMERDPENSEEEAETPVNPKDTVSKLIQQTVKEAFAGYAKVAEPRTPDGLLTSVFIRSDVVLDASVTPPKEHLLLIEYHCSDRRVYPEVQLNKLEQGTYNWIIRDDPYQPLVFGKVLDPLEFGVKHTQLANLRPCYAAGEAALKKNTLTVNLNSGSYNKKYKKIFEEKMGRKEKDKEMKKILLIAVRKVFNAANAINDMIKSDSKKSTKRLKLVFELDGHLIRTQNPMPPISIQELQAIIRREAQYETYVCKGSPKEVAKIFAKGYDVVVPETTAAAQDSVVEWEYI
eukprot:GILK01005266.1.p1 GENE.GILK01005266.1~~GILK01005266.1.p1  ORF type:complete len:381 (-),score=83.64 GILK01005266.1:110-1219(-)